MQPITGEIVLRKVWDEDSQSLKVTMGDAQFAIALDHTEDSVKSASLQTEASGAIGTDEIVATIDISNMKSVCMYAAPDTVGNKYKLQVSPVDSGDLWIDVPNSEFTASTSDYTISAIHQVCAKRARMVCSSNVGTQTELNYIIAQSV